MKEYIDYSIPLILLIANIIVWILKDQRIKSLKEQLSFYKQIDINQINDFIKMNDAKKELDLEMKKLQIDKNAKSILESYEQLKRVYDMIIEFSKSIPDVPQKKSLPLDSNPA